MLRIVKPILQVKILLSLAAICVIVFTGSLKQTGWMGRTNWYVLFFTSGAVVSAYVFHFILKEKFQRFRSTHQAILDNLLDWLRYCLASVYLGTSVFKLVFFDSYDSQFMRESGFADAFIVSIILIEGLGAIVMLSKKASAYAATALLMVMAGAIGTHYMNYFTKGMSGPFENSSMAMALIPLLVLVIITRK